MTVAFPTDTRPAARPGDRPMDRLERTHRAWVDALRTVVSSADAAEAGIWPRWNAIRYFDTFLQDQFDRERKAMDRLGPSIGSDGVGRLWPAGELVGALRWQLRHAAGLCHWAPEFSTIMWKLVKAVECWFAAVEATIGSLEWDRLPSETRQELLSLTAEAAPR